jgi:hypothetical protein
MGKINWTRVFLCGLVAGGVWTVLSATLVTLVGQELLTALTGDRPISARVHVFLFVSDLAAGIWAMWLYAAIRPRYGAGPKTAVVAGLAWWTIATMQSGKWVALLDLAPKLVAPLGTNLAVIVVAALIGAWPYQESTPSVTADE